MYFHSEPTKLIKTKLNNTELVLYWRAQFLRRELLETDYSEGTESGGGNNGRKTKSHSHKHATTWNHKDKLTAAEQ